MKSLLSLLSVVCTAAFAGSDVVGDVEVRFGKERHGLPVEEDRKNLSVKVLRKDAARLLMRRFDRKDLLIAVDRITKKLREAGYRDCRVNALIETEESGVSIRVLVHAGPKVATTTEVRGRTGAAITRFGGWPGKRRRAGYRDYLRVLGHRSKAGVLTWHVQSAARLLVHPETRIRVLMVGVSHVGESGYYRSLERQLDAAGIVFAEGPVHPRERHKLQFPPDTVFRRRGNRAAARVAGLSVQPKWERLYADDRWRMADLTIEKILDLSKKRGPTIGEDTKKWVAAMERLANSKDPLARRRARGALALSMRGAEMDPDYHIRERILWEKLNDAIRTRKIQSIAVLYGAAHLARVENRLQEAGFRLYAITWHDVFEFVDDSR